MVTFCRLYIRPALGRLPLRAITPEAVEDLVASVVRDGKLPTARRLLDVLRKIFNDARRWYYLSRNPAETVRVKSDWKPPGILSVDEACRLLSAVHPQWRPLVLVAMLTGLRWGELVALR